MSAKITLRKFVSTEYYYRNENGVDLTAWPLRVEAHGVDIPDQIFVYQHVDDLDPIPGDRFSCISSLTQLMELPTSTTHVTTEDQQQPFYRRSTVEVFCDCPEDVERVWQQIIDRTSALVRAWNAKDRLFNTIEAVVTESTTTEQIPMITPINLTLSYHPAGTVVLFEGYPVIDVADTSIKGWLPVASYAGAAPAGSVYFYNYSEDSAFADALDRINSVDIQNKLMFFFAGEKIPYGRGWLANSNTLFWMGGSDLLPEGPWPADYVDPDFPGTNPSTVQLTVFPEV